MVEFTNAHLDIVRFCSIECELQMSGERSVTWMVNGWQYAQMDPKRRPTITDITRLGMLVEPEVNRNGFRQCGVRVGNAVKMEWDKVPRAIDMLVENGTDLTPADWFREYEEIHPFEDGNGRSGAILFNWLNGTLDAPVWPPNFWQDHRRTMDNGLSDLPDPVRVDSRGNA